MKSNKINYLVVGVFVIIMLILFIGSVAMLTGRTGATDEYFAVYDNVTGIKFGTQVRYEGYPIGQVEEVTPIEEQGRMRFRVDMSVIEGWKIPDNSIAEIAAPGLLAAITIAVSAGDSKAALAPGDRIKAQERSDVFAAIGDIAGQIGDLSDNSIKPLLGNLNDSVLAINKLLIGDGAQIIADLKDISTLINDTAPQIVANLDESIDGLKSMTGGESSAKVQAMISSLEKLSNDLNETRNLADVMLESATLAIHDNRGDMDAAVDDLKYVMASTARRIDDINQNLELAARNAAEFTRQIRANPGLLLGGGAPKDEAD